MALAVDIIASFADVASAVACSSDPDAESRGRRHVRGSAQAQQRPSG